MTAASRKRTAAARAATGRSGRRRKAAQSTGRSGSSGTAGGGAGVRRGPTLKKRMERLASDMVDSGLLMEEALEQLEKCFLERVLREVGGNQTRAAQRLQLHRNTLRRKMERHGLL